MKRAFPLILLVIFLGVGYLAIGVVSTSNARPARPIKIASGTWEPFIGPNLEENGPLAGIVSETIQRMGYEPQISFSSWDLTLAQTRRAEVLGAFPFISTSNRRAQYDFSDPILEFEYVIFYNTQTVTNPEAIRTAVDLANSPYRFGKVAGYEVWAELTAAVPAFIEYDTSLVAFEALAAGEIDFLPEGRLPGQAIIYGPDILVDVNRFGILEDAGNNLLSAREGLYFLMPKSDESRQFLDAFNVALAEVKETALYREAVVQMAAEAPARQVVRLQPVPGADVIPVTAVTDAADSFLVPLGTEAVVVAWPESYAGSVAAASDGPHWVEVKLLNGPQRGRIVLVDSRMILLIQ